MTGELHRVANQVHQHLTQAVPISHQLARDVRRHVDDQRHALDLGADDEDIGHAFHQLAQIEGARAQEDLIRFDPRRVQQVADQHRQRLGVAVHRFGEFPLLVIEPGFEQQFAHPRHRVERRADLVADGGEKPGLGLTGRIRGLRRLLERPLEELLSAIARLKMRNAPTMKTTSNSP